MTVSSNYFVLVPELVTCPGQACVNIRGHERMGGDEMVAADVRGKIWARINGIGNDERRFE